MDTQKDKATRCKDCKWIHEADSNHPENNFMGVELCAKHSVNHALLEACKEAMNELIRIAKNQEDFEAKDLEDHAIADITVIAQLSQAIHQATK